MVAKAKVRRDQERLLAAVLEYARGRGASEHTLAAVVAYRSAEIRSLTWRSLLRGRLEPRSVTVRLERPMLEAELGQAVADALALPAARRPTEASCWSCRQPFTDSLRCYQRGNMVCYDCLDSGED